MTNTIPNVPRELLERVLGCIDAMGCDRLEADIRALLSAPSPAGADGLEVVAWRIGFPNNSGYKVYEQRQPWAYEQYGVPSSIVYEVQELCRLSDATTIIDGLRGEVEDLQMELSDTEERRATAAHNSSAFEDRMGDLQVQNGKLRDQRDQLAALLRELSAWITDLPIPTNGATAKLLKIDASLSSLTKEPA